MCPKNTTAALPRGKPSIHRFRLALFCIIEFFLYFDSTSKPQIQEIFRFRWETNLDDMKRTLTALRVRRTRLIVRIHLPAIIWKKLELGPQSHAYYQLFDHHKASVAISTNFPYKNPRKKTHTKKRLSSEHLLEHLWFLYPVEHPQKSWGFFWSFWYSPKNSPLSDNYLLQRCWSESTVDASEIRDQLTSWGW